MQVYLLPDIKRRKIKLSKNNDNLSGQKTIEKNQSLSRTDQSDSNKMSYYLLVPGRRDKKQMSRLSQMDGITNPPTTDHRRESISPDVRRGTMGLSRYYPLCRHRAAQTALPIVIDHVRWMHPPRSLQLRNTTGITGLTTKLPHSIIFRPAIKLFPPWSAGAFDKIP